MKNTYTWLYNIIESCNNDFHLDCADVLIALFNVQSGDEAKVNELKSLWQNKWNETHGILV